MLAEISSKTNCTVFGLEGQNGKQNWATVNLRTHLYILWTSNHMKTEKRDPGSPSVKTFLTALFHIFQEKAQQKGSYLLKKVWNNLPQKAQIFCNKTCIKFYRKGEGLLEAREIKPSSSDKTNST